MCRFDRLTCFYIFIYILKLEFTVCDNSGATIINKPNNPKDDAKVLYTAMKGWGTTEKDLIKILALRTGKQREEISATYYTTYKTNLKDDLEGDTSGDFEDVLVDLTYSVEEFLSREINSALKDKKNWAYIKIICACDATQIQEIKKTYLRVFKVSLPVDIEQKVTYIPTRVLLLRILSGFDLPFRDPNAFNEKAIKDYLKSIPAKKDDCRIDLNGPLFTLMSAESIREIQSVVRTYNDKKDHKDHPVSSRIEEFCEDESLRTAYITISEFADDPAKYFAKKLRDSIKGIGTSEKDLNRIIIWRSEIDLVKIQQAFYQLTQESLEKWVKGDTSGDYQSTIVTMLKGNTK